MFAIVRYREKIYFSNLSRFIVYVHINIKFSVNQIVVLYIKEVYILSMCNILLWFTYVPIHIYHSTYAWKIIVKHRLKYPPKVFEKLLSLKADKREIYVYHTKCYGEHSHHGYWRNKTSGGCSMIIIDIQSCNNARVHETRDISICEPLLGTTFYFNLYSVNGDKLSVGKISSLYAR